MRAFFPNTCDAPPLLSYKPIENIMPWLQLRITSDPNEAQAIESAMLANGANAVTMEDNADQPIFEPAIGETPLWQATRITGLFDAKISTMHTLERIQQHYRKPMLSSHWHVLEDKDWEREWEKNYHPIQCADNLWICPSWIAPPNPDATNLMLDPGLAFGSGTHPTTFMCLQWLATQHFEGQTVIDYGCGSGILGIASLLMGALSVQGIDIDPQALIATQNNAAGNQLDADVFPVFLPGEEPSITADFMLANILAGPLVELAPTLLSKLKPGGKLCLSGVIESQIDSVLNAYSDVIDFMPVHRQEEWVCFTGVKKPS